MPYSAFYKIFFKRKGQIHSNFDKKKFFNLTVHSAGSCSSCNANCICHRFLIIQFLAIKLWVRIPFQVEDSLLALFLCLCISFHKYVSIAF